jgi:hypothetical protein
MVFMVLHGLWENEDAIDVVDNKIIQLFIEDIIQ